MKWISLSLGVPIILLASITPSAKSTASLTANPQAQQQSASETFFGTVLKSDSDFVLSDSATKTRYVLDSAQKVSRYEGTWVKVTGRLDADNKLIHVETIQPINIHEGAVMSDRIDSKAVFFLGGLVVGSMAALLFAPKSGEETREYLTQKARDGNDYAKRKAGELKDQAEGMVDRASQFVKTTPNQIAAAIEAGRKAYRREKWRTHAA